MAFLIGTDEAGYGPNLGPLVVSATVWEVPDGLLRRDLFRTLKKCIANESPKSKSAPANDERVWMGDSKELYKPRGGLANLERGVLAALASVHGTIPKTWQQLLQAIDPDGDAPPQKLPWYEQFDELIPIDANGADVAAAAERMTDELGRCRVRLHQVRSSIICADRFNGLLEKCGNKSNALSHVTLDLVSRLLPQLSGPVLVRCDKHGGRNHYGALLQDWFPEHLMLVKHEGRAESRYQTGPQDRQLEFRFTAKGDRHLPSALASMFSKYLREVAMRAFNTFWCGHLSELKPTAGYPLDAKRFKKEIAEVQSKLGISDAVLWRAR